MPRPPIFSIGAAFVLYRNRIPLIKRYYYGDAVKKLAKMIGCTENQMAQRMMKLRKKLKLFLFENTIAVK